MLTVALPWDNHGDGRVLGYPPVQLAWENPAVSQWQETVLLVQPSGALDETAVVGAPASRAPSSSHAPFEKYRVVIRTKARRSAAGRSL